MKSNVLPTILVAAALIGLAMPAEGRAEDILVAGLIDGLGAEVDPGPDLIWAPDFFAQNVLIGPPYYVAYETTTSVQGDIFDGQILVSSGFVLDLNTGEGILHGHILWEDSNNPESGFEGPFKGKATGWFGPGAGWFDGKWTLKGYGIHQGKTALIDNYGPFSLPQVYEGVIRMPNGL